MLSDNIKNLIKILEESNVDELEISTFWGRQKIRISKNSSSYNEKKNELTTDTATIPVQSSPEVNKIAESEPAEIESTPITKEVALIDDEKTITIKAPLVGTYYASTKPGAAPFIAEGDTINVGQIICIIEAMKIFNEIESEISGKVVKIFIKSGTPIEYDQDLFVVAPE